MSAVDPLTGAYSMPCPAHGTTVVRLSSFRVLDRLAGSAHPAVFRVTFACVCGDEHPALLAHDDLDWSPLGLGSHEGFVNLMTARVDPLAGELVAVATDHIARGEWPWTFYCHLEERPRPVTPSAFLLVAAAERSVGVAVRCPVCGSTSINLVSHAHLDIPFVHDPTVAVVPHVFQGDAVRSVAEFGEMLASSAFDERRLEL
jgi:DNA-binding transcriptional LysR family regulator